MPPKKVGASPAAASNTYRAQSGLEFYPDETSTKFNPLLTIGCVGKKEKERKRVRRARARNKEEGENPIKEGKGQRWEQKVARYIPVARCNERTKQTGIWGIRVEREREREGNAQQSLPVAAGDRAGWKFRRGRGRTIPLGSVGDAGVVATVVARRRRRRRR